MVLKGFSPSRLWKLWFVTQVLFLLHFIFKKFDWNEKKLYNIMEETHGDLLSVGLELPRSQCTIEYANANRLQQDHPCVIELIRRSYLFQPAHANVSLNLSQPTRIDPSGGNQSKLIHGYLGNKTDGFFVECGALDGEYGSNTLYMERMFNWRGILIEGNRNLLGEILSKRRKAWVLPVCLSTYPYPTKVWFDANDEAGKIYKPLAMVGTKPIDNKEDILDWLLEVQCFPLYSILLAVGQTQVEYISLDVEGSESSILMNVPWHLLDIKTLTVEITSRNKEEINRLTRHLAKHGFEMVKLMEGPGYFDFVFIKQDLL